MERSDRREAPRASIIPEIRSLDDMRRAPFEFLLPKPLLARSKPALLLLVKYGVCVGSGVCGNRV